MRRALNRHAGGGDLALKHAELCKWRHVEHQVRHEMEGMRRVGHLPGCLPLHGAYARESPWPKAPGAQYYLAMPCVPSTCHPYSRVADLQLRVHSTDMQHDVWRSFAQATCVQRLRQWLYGPLSHQPA